MFSFRSFGSSCFHLLIVFSFAEFHMFYKVRVISDVVRYICFCFYCTCLKFIILVELGRSYTCGWLIVELALFVIRVWLHYELFSVFGNMFYLCFLIWLFLWSWMGLMCLRLRQFPSFDCPGKSSLNQIFWIRLVISASFVSWNRRLGELRWPCRQHLAIVIFAMAFK